MNDDALIEAIAASIQRYLCEHPASADTAEGVQQFWLGGIAHEVSLAMTQAALASLERRGALEGVQMGRHRLWRLRRNSAAA